jgi:thiol-disulfide isomerase/thioredoxin
MSNNLLYLTEKDFFVQNGKKGPLLCCNTKGVTFVLFYAKSCPHCSDVFPIFQELPRILPSCQIALINVTSNMNVAQMSKDTTCPITYVPLMILFINGRPFMKYTGAKTLQDIYAFLQDVLNKLQTKRNFAVPQKDLLDDDVAQFANGMGIPYNLVVCDGEQCYLSFKDAYSRNR